MTSKKRGAPAGNLNALRHGLYSKFYRPEEAKRLEIMHDLSEEIAVLRVILGRLMALADVEDEAFKASALASAMADCAAKIGNLYRTRGFLSGAAGEAEDMAEKMIRELKEAMKEYHDSSSNNTTARGQYPVSPGTDRAQDRAGEAGVIPMQGAAGEQQQIEPGADNGSGSAAPGAPGADQE